MKKYIIFFISIGLLLGIVLFYNTMSVEENKKVTFNESGYILNSSSDRYYFYEDETYTTSYNNKIVFFDTEGAKVTLGNDNFIHYSSGNIVGLQEGVLLELGKIDDNPIIYYNVAANKEIKKLSNRYIVKNLDKDLQFEQAIWKISTSKYIILGNNIKIKLENGTEKEVQGYVEIEYSDNEIINIYNQEISYQTISSDSYIELDDDIKINLGTKIVSKKDKNKMSLEDMVINSDDNVTLIDLNTDKETEIENDVSENNTTEQNGDSNSEIIQSGTNTGTTNSNSNSTSSSQSTIINPETNVQGAQQDEENIIDIQTPEIKYEESDGNETEIDSSKVLEEPEFKLDNMEVNALSVNGTIKIIDDNDLLSKEENIIIKIINNNTGKTVYNDKVAYGTLSIPLSVETLLPNTQYTVVVSATYVINEIAYTKNFIYKTFVTSEIGIEINKNGFTNHSLNFLVSFKDELITAAKVTILDENGTEVPNRKQPIKNKGKDIIEVNFDGLQSDTKYKIKISDIQYGGATQNGSNWVLYYDDCKTLKSKASIDTLNYRIDKRNGKFKLFIEKITDENNSIQNYTYVIYEYKKTTDLNGKETLSYDTENVIYTKEGITEKEITVDVGNADNLEGIVRDKYYGFRIIANSYDNEKYVEIASDICGPFILSGRSFPTVKFVQEEITATDIEGTIHISDPDNSIEIDGNNPLSIRYKNYMGDEETFFTTTNTDIINITDDENGEKVIVIPVKLEKLKAETSYVFSVYGSVDLEDGNTYTNIFIGSTLVNTNSYKQLKANFSVNKSDEPKNTTFAIDINLEGEEFEKDSLESITFIMQEGSDFKPTDNYWSLEINNTNCSSYAKVGTKVESLKDLLCGENSLTITPSMIGGGREKDYTEVNYVLLATITVDGTKYPNKIPIYAEKSEKDRTGTTTFTDKNEEKYTAAYIIADGQGTVSDMPKNPEKAVEVIAITNDKANDYQFYDNKLNNNTIVGYEVKADFNNSGSRSADSITYYVWDKNGNPIYGEDGKQLTYIAKFTDSKTTPTAVFKVGYGTMDTTLEDNQSGLHRGGAYYFSFTVTYIDENGKEEIWPTMVDSTMNEKSLRSDKVVATKQEPSFIIYPKISDEETMTYIYTCFDYDKALNYVDENTSSLELYAKGTSQGEYEISTDSENNEVKFEKLEKEVTYDIRYKRIVNKAETTTYVAKTLVTQNFGGIVGLSDIKYQVEYDTQKYSNNLRIRFSNIETDIARIAGAKVVLSHGENRWTTNIMGIKYDIYNDEYYIEVDLLSLSIGSSLINKEIDVSVTLYYDNERFGYILGEDGEYTTYLNTSNEYKYMSLDEEGNFIEDSNYSINGNVFKYELDTQTSKEYAYLKIQDILGRVKTLELKYTDKGFMYGENVILQKQIATKEIDTSNEHKFTLNSINLGIKVEKIETSITEAQIQAQLINPLNLSVKDNKIYVEIFGTTNKNQIVNWANAETIEIDINNINDFTLKDLEPASYYTIRFKYILDGDTEYTYMYDVETGTIMREYTFETFATIGIQNVTLEYEANSYIEKYLRIKYNVDSARSNMYKKTKYEFYEYNTSTKKYDKLDLNSNNIFENTDSGNIYEVIDGNLFVENAIYKDETKTFDTVIEKINISPENNIFTFGNRYKVLITPIVENEGTEITLESVETIKTLSKLSDPIIGIKMIRVDKTEQKYIRAAIAIEDDDNIIIGDEYGQYTLKIYKYKLDNKSDKQQVDIYDLPNGGNNITSNIFNLLKHSGNYSVYIPNADFSYNYELELHYQTNKENKKDNFKNEVVKSSAKAIENQAGIDLGSVSLVKNNNNVDIISHNGYKVTDVNYIQFTVRNNNNALIKAESFAPTSEDWTVVTESELTSYAKVTLPVEFQDYGTYIITINFYKNDASNGLLFVGTKEINYTYTGEE